jgi:tetratricopeptide (TPR) repeat protein
VGNTHAIRAFFSVVVLLTAACPNTHAADEGVAPQSTGAGAQTASWTTHSQAGNCSELAKACDALLAAENTKTSFSAHMCKVNAALCGNSGISIAGGQKEGFAMSGGFAPGAVTEALSWIDKAEALYPQNIKAIQTRLQLLVATGDGIAAGQALDAYLKRAKNKPGVDEWLNTFGAYFGQRKMDAAIAFGKVIEKHYPNSHQIHGNLGGAYAQMEKDVDAFRHLNKAVELAPNDPINRWNLARLYDFTNKVTLAETHYSKAIADETDSERRNEMNCAYSKFVGKKLKDTARAKRLQPKDCAS